MLKLVVVLIAVFVHSLSGVYVDNRNAGGYGPPRVAGAKKPVDFEIFRAIQVAEYHTEEAPPPPPFTTQVRGLVHLSSRTFQDISDLAVEDNGDVGGSMALAFDDAVTEVYRIFTAYKNRRRFKRDEKSDADAAKNKIGQAMIDAGDKVAADKSKLSPAAQDKMDKMFEKAFDKCDAEVCKSHSEKLKKLKAAKAKKG